MGSNPTQTELGVYSKMLPGAAREDCVLVAEIVDLRGLVLGPLKRLQTPAAELFIDSLTALVA